MADQTFRKLESVDRYLARVRRNEQAMPQRNLVHTEAKLQSNSLRAWCPPAYDQGRQGSCSANTIAHMILTTSGQCGSGKPFPPDFEPSRAYLYRKELMLENPGTPLSDLGADPADGCRIIATTGVCSERLLPYSDDSPLLPPNEICDADAQNHIFPMFANVTNNGDPYRIIQTCIDQGEPLSMSFLVFQSLMTAAVTQSGKMPIPSPFDFAMGPVGGHAVMICGYTPTDIEILNSWSPTWGDGGFFHMPRAVLTQTFGGAPIVSQLLTLRPILAPKPIPQPTPVPPPVPIPGAYTIAQAQADLAAIGSALNGYSSSLSQLANTLPQLIQALAAVQSALDTLKRQ